MGSSVSERYDDHDIYEHICERFGQEPKSVSDDFYAHAGEIIRGLSSEKREMYKYTYWYRKFEPYAD